MQLQYFARQFKALAVDMTVNVCVFDLPAKVHVAVGDMLLHPTQVAVVYMYM